MKKQKQTDAQLSAEMNALIDGSEITKEKEAKLNELYNKMSPAGRKAFVESLAAELELPDKLQAVLNQPIKTEE